MIPSAAASESRLSLVPQLVHHAAHFVHVALPCPCFGAWVLSNYRLDRKRLPLTPGRVFLYWHQCNLSARPVPVWESTPRRRHARR